MKITYPKFHYNLPMINELKYDTTVSFQSYQLDQEGSWKQYQKGW